MSRRWAGAIFVAIMILITGPGVVSAAQTRIGINGARPIFWPVVDQVLANAGYTQESWFNFASRVGANWLPGTTPVPLNYPAQLGIFSGPGALTADQSTEAGQRLLHAAILRELQHGGPIAVAGLSEGTLVIDRELRYLQNATDAPPAGDITFYIFGGQLRGFGDMYLPGVSIPIIGQTFGPIPESQYDVVVVNEQWDGWANPPDRPWNLLAVVNAVIGAVLIVDGVNDHSRTGVDSLSDAVLVSRTTNSRGGTTSTYMIYQKELPITRPLRAIGVPDGVVDEIDKALMPLVSTGYSSLTPYLGPRVQQGRLVFTPPSPPVIEPEETTNPVDVSSTSAGAIQRQIISGGSTEIEQSDTAADESVKIDRDRDIAGPLHGRFHRYRGGIGSGGPAAVHRTDRRSAEAEDRARPDRLKPRSATNTDDTGADTSRSAKSASEAA